MDTLPSPAGDLNDLERRLSTLQPSTLGLDAGQMLFAAGRDSVRPGWGRAIWPIVSGVLALLVAVLGVGFAKERTARLELTAEYYKHYTIEIPAPSSMPEVAYPAEPPAADSYLAARRAMMQNIDGWPVFDNVEPAPGPLLPNQRIWNAGSRGDGIEP
jgi:hypothetical protein